MAGKSKEKSKPKAKAAAKSAAKPKRSNAAVIEETGEEPRMPGHESQMRDKPEWEPRYPGSGRLAGKVAIVTGGGTNLGLSASGDTLYAYLGTATAPTIFLTAIGSESSTANITNAGLIVGVNAVKIATGADFGEYTGARTGQASFAAYATLVNDGANWNVYTDGDRSALVPSTVPFEVTAVPEAETYAMMLAGLGLVGWMAARRSKA